MDFLAHAEHFITALRAAKDDNPKAQRQQEQFLGQLEAFVSAWRSLIYVYLHPPPCLPKFTDLLKRLKSDNGKIVLDLGQKLSGAIAVQNQARSGLRFYTPRGSGHSLIAFFGIPLVRLRQKQIVYATTVVKLISLIVIHVDKHEYKYSNQNDWTSAREAQMEAYLSQSRAKRELECRVPDDLVKTDLWLEGFNWTSELDHLPLAVAANRWFDIPLFEQRIPDPRPRDTDYDLHLEQIHIQMQDLEAHFNGQRQEDRTKLERIEKDWDDRYKEQMEISQKLEQDLGATNAELEKYKHDYRVLCSKYRRQIAENRRLIQELHQSEQEKQDLEHSTNSLKAQLAGLKGRIRILDEENALIKREKEALEAETRSYHVAKASLEAAKQTLEPNGQVTGVRDVVPSSRARQPSVTPPALSQQRGRTLPQPYRTVPTEDLNKRTYPPVSYPIASKSENGRKRGLSPATVSESSSRFSSAASRDSSSTSLDSSRTSSMNDRSRRERACSSCDLQPRGDHISVRQPRTTPDKHESDAGTVQSRDSRLQLGGSREERHHLARAQRHKHQARDYPPSTEQTLAASRTTSYRSDESRAKHQTSLPDPVTPHLSAQFGHATSSIGALFDHQPSRKFL